MTNLRNIFGALTIVALLFSCNIGEKKNEMAKQETPEALKENKVDWKSYSRSEDLIDQLYEELVGKTPELKKLEEDIDALRPKENELNGKFEKYNSKSNSFYSSAEYNAAYISDSTLKHKILALLKTSRKQYDNKISELTSLLNRVSGNSLTLKDHHTVLKIALTLPLLEKYQSDNQPGKNDFKNLVKEQEKVIEHAEHLTSPQS